MTKRVVLAARLLKKLREQDGEEVPLGIERLANARPVSRRNEPPSAMG